MKHIPFLLLFVLLIGCTTSPTGYQLPDVTFQHLKPIAVDVSNISYTNKAGNVPRPDDFYLNIPYLAETYIQRRFKASELQNQNTLAFELETVDVSTVQESSDNDFARFLDVAKHDKYRVLMTLNMVHDDVSRGFTKGQRINVERVMNISEHVSLDERERRQMEGMESLFAQMDAAIIETFRDEFGIVQLP